MRSAPYDSILPFPTINNHNEVAFTALLGADILRVLPNDARTSVATATDESVRPLIADDGQVVLRRTDETGDSIIQASESGANQVAEEVVAAVPAWPTLGQEPGELHRRESRRVCRDTWVRTRSLSLSQRADPTHRPSCRTAWGDEVKPNLGLDKDVAPIYFETIDLNSRVAVLHEEAGTPGLAGDSILVSFVAKPNKVGGGFTDQMGIWTLRLAVDADDTGGIREAETLPVFHVGGTLAIPSEPDAPVKVTDLIVYDQLAKLNSSDPAAGDHQLAFWAQGGGRQLVVKATHRRSAAP